MRAKILQLALFIVAIGLARCGDDEKPKTIPVLTTSAATDVQTNSATLTGEITDDGNAPITAGGFVYSSTVGTPTIADDKIEVTDKEGEFTIVLEGLASGTTYNVRAFATNSVGTGYGDVANFSTGNVAPVASNVAITGTLEVNRELTVTYAYTDAESDMEGATEFQWYMADDAAGAGVTPIEGATESTLTIQDTQQGKYLGVGVTPKATAGTTTGAEAKSTFVGAVGEATTVTFMYNGQDVVYGIITSTTTGKKWLDRNLGAPNVPTAVDDYANYGDLFQWGRLDDGHQMITRTGPAAADAMGVNGTTSSVAPYETSSSDNPGHNKFIVAASTTGGADGPDFDWRKPQNNNLWQGTNPINNPCPTGWRIPTMQEWAAESIINIADGYSKLALTYTGFRISFSGNFSSSGATGGYYWSSTVDPANPTLSSRVRFNASSYQESSVSYRGTAYACRCIQD